MGCFVQLLRFLRLVRKVPGEDPTSLGNLAVREGHLTTGQLRSVLENRVGNLLLGQVLVEASYLTQQQRDDLMRLQLRLRNARPSEFARFELEVQRQALKQLGASFRAATAVAKKFIEE